MNLRLLEMVQDKFGDLACQQPPSGRYDEAYFRTQLILAEMLIKHHLPLQAFTMRRECVASMGMLGVQGKYAEKSMLADFRNGFDHAWIVKGGVPAGVLDSGRQYLEALQTVFCKLHEAGLVKPSPQD